MWSLNVSIPQNIIRAIEEVTLGVRGWEEICEEPTLVIKRFEKKDLDGHVKSEIRFLLESVEPFGIEIGNLERFDVAERGSSPVLYLEIKSPGVKALHENLIDIFGSVEGVEGENYIPHITIARGGSGDYIEFSGLSCDTGWTVEMLEFWDGGERKKRSKIILEKNK